MGGVGGRRYPAESRAGPERPGAERRERANMTGAESIVGLVLSLLAIVYLVYALLFPEKL